MEYTSPNGQVFASKQDYITQVMIAYITKTEELESIIEELESRITLYPSLPK